MAKLNAKTLFGIDIFRKNRIGRPMKIWMEEINGVRTGRGIKYGKWEDRTE